MVKKKKITTSLAVASLLINVLLLPGLGTIISGMTTKGVIQLVIYSVSTITAVISIFGIMNPKFLVLFIVTSILAVSMWIWALICSIKLIKEAQ